MQTIIAGTDRTSEVIRNSIKIYDELQEKPNRATLKLGTTQPDEYDDIKIYESFEILAVDATTIKLSYDKRVNDKTSIFEVGGTIVIDIAEATEFEKEITAIDSDSLNNIILTVITAGADGTVGKYAGVNVFAGNVITVSDKNIDLLPNIEYSLICLDYTRLFDKVLVNDTYQNEGARYIINDFCNVHINKNEVIDQMDYATDGDLQAEWVETGDGDNPTTDLSDYREGSASGVFSWTFAGGTATFTASPSSIDLSDLTGAASGAPIKGVFGFWYKCADVTKVTSFVARIGSSSANYAQVTVTPTDNKWTFVDLLLEDAAITGTPDWTAADYLAVVITETDDSEIQFDGFRILEEEFFAHYPFVQDSSAFEDFRAPLKKPTEVMQRIADELGWYWYIDYDRNIHLFSRETNNAPFNIDETSNNFTKLSIKSDTSRLMNRITVKGGESTSTSVYPQVVEGDGIVNEWIMKNKFKNLEVLLDDDTSTDTMEAGTDTTTVKASLHGLAVDDYITNRTRSDAVRKVLTVPDAGTFTVEAVVGQTSGDSFSLYVAQVIGIEGINEDAGNDYMSNFNEKSIRGASGQDILLAAEFLLFRYNEVFPIRVKVKENVSIARLKSVLGYTTGIVDGQPITDTSIKTKSEAISLGEASLAKYADMIITAKFQTTVNGLRSGQLINIKDTASGTRNIDQQFLIQKVVKKEFESSESIFTVTCSSLLFGMIELLQQLLRQDRRLDVSEDAIIENIEAAADEFSVADSASSLVQTPPHKWMPSGTNPLTWNRGEWS